MDFLSSNNRALVDKFLKSPEHLAKNVRVAIKEGMELVVKQAAKKHRYSSNGSGNLSKAFVTKMHNDYFGEVFLDGSVSGAGAYDYAIHQGHSGPNTYKNMGNQTWKKDPFLTNAGKAKKQKTVSLIAKAVNKTVREFK